MKDLTALNDYIEALGLTFDNVSLADAIALRNKVENLIKETLTTKTV